MTKTIQKNIPFDPAEAKPMTDYLMNRLISLAPPPATPIHNGTPNLWPEVESRIGTKLPADYKSFIEIYGSGGFNDFLEILSPFAPKPCGPKSPSSLMEYRILLETYNDARADMPTECHYPAYPETGGLLPVGGDTNGCSLFWLTEGEPDSWNLIYYDWRGGYESERYHMSLTALIVGWLSRELSDCFFGVGSEFIGRTDPVFTQ